MQNFHPSIWRAKLVSELCLGCTDLHQYHDRSESCNIDYTGYISNINLGYATLVYATLNSGICHFPFWHMPLSILAYATFQFGICHFPFRYMPISILAYTTFHSGTCHFPFWYMPFSIVVLATFHFGICNFPFWYMPSVAEWSRRTYPAPLGAGGVGSIPANS